MSAVTKINAAFHADPSGFQKGVGTVLGELQKTEKGIAKTKTALARLQEGFVQFGKNVAMGAAAPVAALTAIAGAATAAGAVLWRFTREGANIVDPLAKMSNGLAMNTGELMGLVHGAELAGASTESLANGMKRMLQGIAQGKDIFGRLGLDTARLQAMSTGEAFMLVADRIKGLGDPAQQTAAAIEAFGRGGTDLMTFILGGSKAMREAAEEAKALGYHIDRVDAYQLESFNDALSKMGKLWQGIKIQVARFLGPILEAGLSRVVEWLKETGGASVWVEKAFDAVATGLAGFLDGLSHARIAWQELKVGFHEFRSTTISGFEDIANTAIDKFNAIVKTFNRLPGVNLALAPEFKVSGADEVRAAAEREAAKLEEMQGTQPLGQRFLVGLTRLRVEGNRKAREGLEAMQTGPHFDLLDKPEKDKAAVEKVGKGAENAAKGFDTLAKSAEAAHEAIRGDNRAGTGGLLTTAFPAVGGPSQVGSPGGSHMNIPQVNIPSMGRDSEAAILQQMAGYLRQMTHQLSTAPTLRTA